MAYLTCDSVKVCTECARRTWDGNVAELGNKMSLLLKRQLEKDGLLDEITVSQRSCLGTCPDDGIAVSLGRRDRAREAERYTVFTKRDLDFIYARMLGEV